MLFKRASASIRLRNVGKPGFGLTDTAASLVAVLSLVVVLGSSVVSALAAQSAPLSLDKSFGHNGATITRFGRGKGIDSSADAVVVQKDGKIVAAGGTGAIGRSDRNQGGSDPADFALARYNADGSLDESFGTAGKVTTELHGKDGIHAVLVQPDGKIVAGGQSCGRDPAGGGTPDECVFAVARYTPKGVLDPTFGIAGVVTTDIGYDAHVAALALTTDGKILAVGAGAGGAPSKSPDRPDGETAVVRYTANGVPDDRFGAKGIKSLNLGIHNGSLDIGLLVQPEGKTIVAAAGDSKGPPQMGIGDDSRDFVLVRLDKDGALDATFGTNGKTSTDFGGSTDVVAAVGAQSDGKIVVAGTKQIKSKSQFLLARYDSNGILDPKFGSAGSVTTSPDQQATAAGLGIRSDDSLVVGGSTYVQGAETTDTSAKFAVAEFSRDGALLAPAGAKGPGVLLSDLGSPRGFNVGQSVGVAPDGGIIVAGESGKKLGDATDFALVRYGGPASGDKEAAGPESAPTNKAPWVVGLLLVLGLGAGVVVMRRRRA